MKNLFLSIFAALTLFSCATKSDFVPFQEISIEGAEFHLQDVVLESIFAYENMEGEIRSLIQSMGVKYNMVIHLTPKAGSYPLNVTIRDKNYVSGFETLHSIAVIKTVSDPQGDILARFFFAEDTRTPLDSFLALYTLMDQSFELFSQSFHQSFKQGG